VAVVAEQGWAMLEQWRLPAPVVGVAVAVVATAPLAADQGDLLVPSWRDAAMQVDAVCARVRAELDPGGDGDVVVRPVAGDAHRPEGAGRWVAADLFAMGEAPLPVDAVPRAAPDPAVPTAGALAAPVVLEAVLRLLDPPEPVEVERPHGCPEALWWRGTRWALVAVAGPERLDGNWWRGEATVRDYWRGTVPGEGELLLYHQPGAGWYVQGWYD
jgi:hypothetical protein